MSYFSDEPTDKDMLWAEGYAYARAQVDDLEERNARLVAAFMYKLREENECSGPCADNQKCGCRGEMQNYIALANQQSTEKP